MRPGKDRRSEPRIGRIAASSMAPGGRAVDLASDPDLESTV